MMTIAAICIGGFFGAILRFFIFQLFIVKERATLFVNITGSFVIGFVVPVITAEWLYVFVVIGFLGAYTTFSTFTFDAVQLYTISRKQAYTYVVRTIMYSLLAVVMGYLIGTYL